MSLYFSIIIPVYNRPDEMKELLASLQEQTVRNFELIVVEDGSTVSCKQEIDNAIAAGLDVKYFWKPNEGRSIARNYGMNQASGNYFVFFDSDCVIPPQYFEVLERELDKNGLDCFGGPDAASEKFSDLQKAISYSMTSFLTTGGIRGGKVSMEKFTPRTFNMGFSKDVYATVGGFREMFSEDIDMSKRIQAAGFSIGLIADSPVWHKRRISFGKFFRQVYVFGMSRITLKLLYPDSLKVVHTLPALFVLGVLCCIILGIVVSPWVLAPVVGYFIAIFIGALIKWHSLKVALLAVPATAVQLGGYGLGFIKAFFENIVLGRGRNADKEIEMRKGK